MNRKRRILKIGLDFHGVINKNLSYFQRFCDALSKRGHHVYILTGGPKSTVKKDLKKAKIKYKVLFTIFDFYQAKGLVSCQGAGHFQIDEKLWNTAKADYCRSHNIDVQIDDSLIYGKYFTTPYCLYTEINCLLLNNKEKIDLSVLTPEQAVLELETKLN